MRENRVRKVILTVMFAAIVLGIILHTTISGADVKSKLSKEVYNCRELVVKVQSGEESGSWPTSAIEAFSDQVEAASAVLSDLNSTDDEAKTALENLKAAKETFESAKGEAGSSDAEEGNGAAAGEDTQETDGDAALEGETGEAQSEAVQAASGSSGSSKSGTKKSSGSSKKSSIGKSEAKKETEKSKSTVGDAGSKSNAADGAGGSSGSGSGVSGSSDAGGSSSGAASGSQSGSSKKNSTKGSSSTKETEKKTDTGKKNNRDEEIDISDIGKTQTPETKKTEETNAQTPEEDNSTKDTEAPQETTEAPSRRYCTISIRCNTVLNNMGDLKEGLAGYIPASGVILKPSKVELYDGETVFEVLKRVTRMAGLKLEFRNDKVHGAGYIVGINHLNEFDCGAGSGWMYTVNGWFPNYGCSKYVLQDNDVIQWIYTCDLGRDIGGNFWE